jgi:hypothetical protein
MTNEVLTFGLSLTHCKRTSQLGADVSWMATNTLEVHCWTYHVWSTGIDELQGRAQQLRAQAIDVLAAPLGGDMLAAEYLLLQLISR